MDAASLRERITKRFIGEIEESNFLSASMLDRAEDTLKTPEDVADFAETLLKKVEKSPFPSTEILDRLDRLVGQLETIERQQRAGRKAT